MAKSAMKNKKVVKKAMAKPNSEIMAKPAMKKAMKNKKVMEAQEDAKKAAEAQQAATKKAIAATKKKTKKTQKVQYDDDDNHPVHSNEIGYSRIVLIRLVFKLWENKIYPIVKEKS